MVGEIVPRMDRYADFGTSVWTVLWVSSKISNTCLLGEKWFNCLVHSDCGNGGLCSIGASTGWAHAYQEGADCILRALHAAAQLKGLSAHDLGNARGSGTELLLRIAFMESLRIYGFRPSWNTCERGGIILESSFS